MRAALLGEGSNSKPDTGHRENDDQHPDNDAYIKPHDALTLTIEARLKRQGKELRLIVLPDSSDNISPRPPVLALIKVIAQAQSWYERLILGEFKSQKLLADETQLEKSYVSRVFQCAFLAPDIVEAILEGRQPEELTLEKLLSGVPMDWTAQRKRLGFLPRSAGGAQSR